MSDIQTRRRKIAFRAARRGIRELDLFMEQFTKVHLGRFSSHELDQFEGVLDIPDQEVFSWIMGRAEPPQHLRTPVLDLVLSFRYSAPR
jgi:antitoxin CptB